MLTFSVYFLRTVKFRQFRPTAIDKTADSKGMFFVQLIVTEKN